jgi:hypothetical protein
LPLLESVNMNVCFIAPKTPECGGLPPPVAWLGLPSVGGGFCDLLVLWIPLCFEPPPHEASLIYHTAVASHRTQGFTSLEFFSMDHH